MKRIAVMCIVLAVVVSWSAAGDWPSWRGPGGNGVAEAGNVPAEFSPTKKVQWNVRLPGKGASTPIVWKDKIFITCGIGEGKEGQDGVLCFDAKGKLLWQARLGRQRPGKHRNGSGCNPSPVTDGQRVFAFFGTG